MCRVVLSEFEIQYKLKGLWKTKLKKGNKTENLKEQNNEGVKKWIRFSEIMLKFKCQYGSDSLD